MFENFTKKNEENNERGNYTDVAVVITDGVPYGRPKMDDKEETMKWATALKDRGVLIIDAPVGKAANHEIDKKNEYQKFIKKLAESPPDNVDVQKDIFRGKLMDDMPDNVDAQKDIFRRKLMDDMPDNVDVQKDIFRGKLMMDDMRNGPRKKPPSK